MLQQKLSMENDNLLIVNRIKKSKLSRDSKQISILKYMTMRFKMKNPEVSIEELVEFFPHKFQRKDNLQIILEGMINNKFITKKDNKYVITKDGVKVPFIVASLQPSNNAHETD